MAASQALVVVSVIMAVSGARATTHSTETPDAFTATLWTDVACPAARGGDGIKLCCPGQSGLACGRVVIEVERRWSPFGADRFWTLMNAGFFNNTAFFRYVPNFVVQFGINPSVGTWQEAVFDDDHDLGADGLSNIRGTVSFAIAGPQTRTTQLFVNLNDNANLDRKKPPFTPIGRVVAGLDLIVAAKNPTPHKTDGVDQDRYFENGNTWLRQNFPAVSFITGSAVAVAEPGPGHTPELAPNAMPAFPGSNPNLYHDAEPASGNGDGDLEAISHTPRPSHMSDDEAPIGMGKHTIGGQSDGGEAFAADGDEVGSSQMAAAGLVGLVVFLMAVVFVVKATLKRGYGPVNTTRLGTFNIDDYDEYDVSESESESEPDSGPEGGGPAGSDLGVFPDAERKGPRSPQATAGIAAALGVMDNGECGDDGDGAVSVNQRSKGNPATAGLAAALGVVSTI